MYTIYYYLAAVFALSLLSNAAPFFGAPYTIYASVILMRLGVTPLNLLLVIATSALGAALAKNVLYSLGVAFRRPLARNRNVAFIKRLTRLGFLWLLIIILAVLPGLPLDDYLYFGMGAAGGMLARLNLYVLVGKLIKSSIEIPIELMLMVGIYDLLRPFNVHELEFQVAFAAVFTVLGIALYKVDWQSVYNAIRAHVGLLPPLED